jgi:hypothetical protein
MVVLPFLETAPAGTTTDIAELPASLPQVQGFCPG